MHMTAPRILTLTLALLAADPALARAAREPVLGGPCEHCDWVFEGIPARVPSVARIGTSNEPGEPMRIDGVVRDAEGAPAIGVIVYAYHTDASGHYPSRGAHPAARRHGRLRGWARTDAQGRYAFLTIRPAGYPGTDIPQHVHLHVIEPGHGTYWIDDLIFTDDPRLTEAQRRSHEQGRGGIGTATPVRDASGHWRVRRDIVLRAGIGS